MTFCSRCYGRGLLAATCHIAVGWFWGRSKFSQCKYLIKLDINHFLLVVLMIAVRCPLPAPGKLWTKICKDITAKNVTTNSVSLHWTLRGIHHCKQYDLMKVVNNIIVCSISQHQLWHLGVVLWWTQLHNTTWSSHVECIRRTHYYPALSSYGMLDNFKPSMTFSPTIQLSAEGKRTKKWEN